MGFFSGGPAAAAVLGAAGVAVTKVFTELGEEVSDRLLGPREKQRIGGVVAIAAAHIRERLERGDHLREDGFFDKGASGRSNADEVAENLVLAVQRDPEERKLQYMGRLYCNVAFNSADKLADGSSDRKGRRANDVQTILSSQDIWC